MFYLKAEYYIKSNGLDKKDFTDEELKELEDRLRNEKSNLDNRFITFYNHQARRNPSF